MGGVGSLVNQMGTCKTGRHIAALKLDVVRHVIATLVHTGCVFIQRFFRRQYGGQLFKFHVDQVERIPCDFFGHCRNSGHLFTRKSHDALSQNTPLFVVHAPESARTVSAGQNRLDARQGQRCRGVDADNARVRVGAA